MKYELTKINYAYDALEPYFDAKTMEIHHTKHHAAYTDKFNAALQGTEWENKSILEIFKNASKLPDGIRNNGGGYYNHDLFWKTLSPSGGKIQDGDLLKAIVKDFGSIENFKSEFSSAAANRFGSGWAWLVKTNNKLVVSSTPNQDNPIMDTAEVKGTPLLGLDVWEHAYYLKYQNRRPEYIDAFWKVVNWEKVEELFNK